MGHFKEFQEPLPSSLLHQPLGQRVALGVERHDRGVIAGILLDGQQLVERNAVAGLDDLLDRQHLASPLRFAFDQCRRPFVGPAGEWPAEVTGEDRVAHFVGNHRVENPLERALHFHVPVAHLGRAVRDRVEVERGLPPGTNLPHLHPDGTAGTPLGQFGPQPLAGDLAAEVFGGVTHLPGDFGRAGLHREVGRLVTVVGGARRAGDPNHPDCPNHPHAPCQARHAGESSLIRSDARAILLPHGQGEEQTAGHPWQESRIGTGGQPGSPLGPMAGNGLRSPGEVRFDGPRRDARSRSGAAHVVRPAIRQSNWAFSVLPRSPVSPACAVPANPDQ